MRRALLLATLLAVTVAPAAHADLLLPPRGKVYTGVTGSQSVGPFTQQVGKHPSVFGFFTWWKGSVEWIYDSVDRSGSRLMLHISTQDGYGTPEAWTPRQISRGLGDNYLINTNRRVAEYGQPTYIRLLAEMNQANNGYCAYNANGTSRGPSHSTAAFKQAWRRATLILRGGPKQRIDERLRRLGMPPVQGGPDTLPRPEIAMLWVPQTEGTPNIRANSARAYWPGAKYVDWVGTDFYSRFPNFTDLETFYDDFGGKPFVFGEWALWGSDDAAFVRRFFDWVEDHPRVKMLLYNQGNQSGGPFRLSNYPQSRAAIRRALRDRRYLGLP
jgi:hypothetical protein